MTDRAFSERERELFDELVLLPRDDRFARARERCGEDSELYRRIERLLLAHERAQELSSEFAGALGTVDGIDVGTSIGPYRLVEKLGEGGMGVVFRAEQSAPIQREVALKVVRTGMDSEAVMARFEAERQTLARMEHPGIARVVDAGSTPSGRPFFVMELVRGLPITRHADHLRLTVRERLELFFELCGAVDHAHQKGVIHRDLKPNNVLVAEGAPPIPKVIDFGIAKATEASAEGLLLTIEDQILGTPAYMSPEQARGGIGDVDTRSDVYSLGVLLYELLAGTPAIQFDPDRGLVAALKDVVEVDPERPSSRAGTRTDASRAAAALRRTQPNELRRYLRGDLDRIVLKAMEKDRERRYGSARALAEDVRRFLASEPIEARPPTVAYLSRRFVQRHRGLTAGLGLAVVAILAGTVASVVWALRADRAAELASDAAREARLEAATSDEVLGFVERLFSAAAPSVADGDEMTVRQVVTTARSGLTERFPSGSRAGARVSAMLGGVLVALGDYPEAERQLEGALPVLVDQEGADDSKVLAARVSRADALRRLDRIDEARSIYGEVVSSIEASTADAELASLCGHASLGLGFIAREAEDLAASEAHFRAAIEWLERGDEGVVPVAEAWGALATCFTLTRRFDESLAALETAREIAGQEAHQLFLARLEESIGNVHAGRGAIDEALAAFQRSVALREAVLDEDHPALVSPLVNVAGMLGASGDLAGAEDLLVRAVEIHRASPADPSSYAQALQNLGNCRVMAGDAVAAIELWEEALEVWIELAGRHSRAAASVYRALAEGHRVLGDEVRSQEMAALAREAEENRAD